MTLLASIFAQNALPSDIIPSPGHWLGLSVRELLVLVGVIVLVTVPFIWWGIYITRRAGRHRQHHHHHHHRHHHAEDGMTAQNTPPVSAEPTSSGAEAGATLAPTPEPSRRRRRRRRRQHHPRNPTLAETGGLPPARPDLSAEPPA